MAGKAWTDKREYKDLTTRLFNREGRRFEDDVVSLLRLARRNVVPAFPLGSVDRAGVDVLVWAEKPPYPLGVQCKGFKEFEKALGNDQIQQCLDSITSFQKSKLAVTHYRLVINRNLEDKTFRETVGAAVKNLETTGRVQTAELWGMSALLREAFQGVHSLLRNRIEARSVEYTRIPLDPFDVRDEPLNAVPLNASELIVSQYRLTHEGGADQGVRDPLPFILPTNKSSDPVIVIGLAGMGKSTLLRRLVANKTHAVVLVPAASIGSEVHSTNELIEACFLRGESVLADDGVDPEIASRIERAVVHHIIKDPSTKLVLAIDALDESVYFTRRGGLQALFNQLQWVRIPIVLTTRTELWNTRRSDFETSAGILGTTCGVKNRRVRLLELEEWNDACILELVGRQRDTVRDSLPKSRLADLYRLIDSGEYLQYYGTIPRTPLFLRMLLDTVQEFGARPANRAKLLTEWASIKVMRDEMSPRLLGGAGREPIVPGVESTDRTLTLAFRVMENAASLMTHTNEHHEVELLPTCSFDALVRTDIAFANVVEPSTIALHTLLAPEPTSVTGDTRLSFRHRIYQEYFLARHVIAHADNWASLSLPHEIKAWIAELRMANSTRG